MKSQCLIRNLQVRGLPYRPRVINNGSLLAFTERWLLSGVEVS